MSKCTIIAGWLVLGAASFAHAQQAAPDQRRTPARANESAQAKSASDTKATSDLDERQEPAQDRVAVLSAEQARQRDRLREQLQKDAKLTSKELQALAVPLDHYVAGGGDGEQLRALVRTSLDAGCKGACIAELVRSLNRAPHDGRIGDAAFATVRAALAQLKQERDRHQLQLSDAQAANRLRARVNTQLTQRQNASHPPGRRGVPGVDKGRADRP